MNDNRDNPAWPPAPPPSQGVPLPNGKKRAISIPSVLLGLMCGGAAYTVGLVALLVGYVILVFVGVEAGHYNQSLSYALFMFKNFVWYAQRPIVFAIPLFMFLLLRKRRFSFAIGFIIGGLITLLLLLLLYPFVPLED